MALQVSRRTTAGDLPVATHPGASGTHAESFRVAFSMTTANSKWLPHRPIWVAHDLSREGHDDELYDGIRDGRGYFFFSISFLALPTR